MKSPFFAEIARAPVADPVVVAPVESEPGPAIVTVTDSFGTAVVIADF